MTGYLQALAIPFDLTTFGAPVVSPPPELFLTARRLGIPPTRYILSVHIDTQSMYLFERFGGSGRDCFVPRNTYRVSTSAFGVGQTVNSNHTPLGLHCIAAKVGGGYPVGTVFKSRQAIGLTWKGFPQAKIVHRILWLAGLEPGFNHGGSVDTFARYVYIHGFGDETTLGTPNSHGCIHLANGDLIPLFDLLPTGTLVWLQKQAPQVGRIGSNPVQ